MPQTVTTVERCPNCHGVGIGARHQRDVDVFDEWPCETCDGEGWIEAEPEETMLCIDQRGPHIWWLWDWNNRGSLRATIHRDRIEGCPDQYSWAVWATGDATPDGSPNWKGATSEGFQEALRLIWMHVQ